jgi:hypothetical protein
MRRALWLLLCVPFLALTACPGLDELGLGAGEAVQKVADLPPTGIPWVDYVTGAAGILGLILGVKGTKKAGGAVAGVVKGWNAASRWVKAPTDGEDLDATIAAFDADPARAARLAAVLAKVAAPKA